VKGAFTALLLTLPSLACAEGLPSQEYSFISSFIQMIAALSIVIGLILITRHFSGKLLKGGVVDRFGSRHIRVVETRAVSPKKSIILIEVGGEYLLLASTENSLNLLKRVEVLEEIEVLEESGNARQELFGRLRGVAGKRRS
jgi:flagellar protein FliO/FliZ